MAVGLNNSSGAYIHRDTTVISDAPITMACWIYPTIDGSILHRVMSYAYNSSNGYTLSLAAGVADDPISFILQNSGGIKQGNTTTGVTFNDVWYHATLVGWYDTDRHWAKVYINGGDSGSDAIIGSMGGVFVRARIGKQYSGGAEFDGHVAEAGIWNVVLSDAEIKALAAGYAPPLIRPQNLKHYLSLHEEATPSVDTYAGLDWAWGGTPTVENHPPNIIYPSQQILGVPALADAGGLPGRHFPRGVMRGVIRGAV